MPAPASGPSPSVTSPSTAAPPRWPGARAGEPTPCWAGCTPTMPRVLTRSRSAAPAVVPFLPAPPSRTRRGGLRRSAHSRDAAPRRGGSGAALDLAPPGRLGPRALWLPLLPRDNPRRPAPPQAVVEESQEAARPGRPRAAAGLCRAAPGRAGRRSTRPAPLGLRGRGAHPPGRGSRLRLGRARPAFMGCLKLARPVRKSLLLRAVPVQRRPGAALALSAGQWRPHDRGAAAPARRGARAYADRALGRGAVSPGPGCPGGRESPGHHADAAAGLQPGSNAGRGALALAARGRHVSPLPRQRRGPDPAGGGLRGAPKPRSFRHRRPALGQGQARPRGGETTLLKLDVV